MATNRRGVVLDHAAVRDLITQQFPELPLGRLRSIDTGGHVVAFLGDDLIFRFPKDALEAAKAPREIRFLTEVGPALPLPVPRVAYVGRPSVRYSFPFTGHRLLPGVTGEDRRPDRRQWPALARQLGAFFSALHATPRAQAERLGLLARPPEPPERLIASATRHAALVRARYPDLVPITADYLAGAVPFPPAGHQSLVVSHADVKGEHVLLDARGDAVVGIIDWSDVALCDPGEDLKGLLIWLGEPFLRQVLDWYSGPLDAHCLERQLVAVRYHSLRNLGNRLADVTDDPLPLLLAQLRWAFTSA